MQVLFHFFFSFPSQFDCLPVLPIIKQLLNGKCEVFSWDTWSEIAFSSCCPLWITAPHSDKSAIRPLPHTWAHRPQDCLLLLWLTGEREYTIVQHIHRAQPVFAPVAPGHGELWHPQDSSLWSPWQGEHLFFFKCLYSVCRTVTNQQWIRFELSLESAELHHHLHWKINVLNTVSYSHHFKEVLHLTILVSVQYSDPFSALILGSLKHPVFWMSRHTELKWFYLGKLEAARTL